MNLKVVMVGVQVLAVFLDKGLNTKTQCTSVRIFFWLYIQVYIRRQRVLGLGRIHFGVHIKIFLRKGEK